MNIINNKRTFIAVRITPDSFFLESLDRIREELSAEEIRWVKPSNYHITLRFLGELDSDRIEVISKALSLVAAESAPFSFSLAGLGVFRSVSYPRVLYTGLNDTEPLIHLKTEIDRRLDNIFEIEDSKVFSPHLTLGRMNRFSNRDSLRRLVEEYRGYEFLKVETCEIIFYESVLGKEGAGYIPIFRYSLLQG